MNYYFKICVLGVAFFGIAFAKAQEITETDPADKKWTLQECVQYALENNISVQLQELGIEEADVNLADAWGNFIPTLSANASLASNTGLSFDPATNQPVTIEFLSATGGLSSSFVLFDGLRNFNQMQRARLTQTLSKFQVEQTENDIALVVADNYLNVLLARENLETLLNQHEVTARQIKITQDQVDAGTLPEGDVLEVKATYANEEQQIVTARNNEQIALISLAQSLNINNYSSFDIADYDLEDIDEAILVNPVEEVAETAVENRPEIKVAEENVAIAEKDLQIARGARYPVLSAFFSYDTRYSENDVRERGFEQQIYENDGYRYGLQLRIPILNNLSISNNVTRSKINLERQRLNKEQAILDLEANIYRAYTDAVASQASVAAAEETVAARELAFDYATQRFDVGLMNSFDYNQAQLQLTNARIDLNVARFNYLFNLKVLEIFFGILPEDLKL